MKSLEGKNAVIIGGESGIGLATSERLLEEGAQLFIAGINQTMIDRAISKMGSNVSGARLDLSDMSDIKAFPEKVGSHFEKIDVLFVNSGVAKFMPFEEATEEAFDLSFNVNVKGAYFLVQALVPIMNKHCSVILNASVNGRIGAPMSSIYAATKAAVRNMARTLSGELVGKGIRVNAISPGPIDTPLYNELGLSEEDTKMFRKQLTDEIALNRFGQPNEVANLVSFLASTQSSFIVGEEIVIDGGMTTI